MMRLRFLAVGVLLVCLTGCGPVSNSVPTPTPTPSVDHDTRQQMAGECLDLWLDTEAPQTLIDVGINTTKPNGDTFSEPAITQDEDGLYHAHPSTLAFAYWANHNSTPYPEIIGAIVAGWGCPYDPVVKAKIEQAEQECLDIWANNEPPQAAIDAGLATTLPDGTSVLPVITQDSAGAYHVDIDADGFQTWVDSKDYYVPWDDITSLTLFGDACPYGPSPEQTPTATAS